MNSPLSYDDRGPLRLPKLRRYTIYFICIGVFLTGVVWIFYHYFMSSQGPFGIKRHPLEMLWLELHAAFSFAAIWAFGLLWSIHVVRGWKARWRRWSGGTLVGFTLVLTITGYGLYYLDSRELRDLTSLAHWILGLIVLIFFFIHWLSKSTPHAREHGPYPWPWHRKRHPKS